MSRSASPSGSAEELLRPLQIFGIRPGLATIEALLADLGRPQERFASVLVAGTNGKGSTSCLLAALAAAAGYRVGLYTSPHLERVTERIRVDGAAIADDRLAAELERILAATRRIPRPPTYFEALTAAAIVHFAAAEVDLAVLEVGLGGRWDATNAVEPVLSLICEISLDHEAHLGDSLAEIAAEKAGIFRQDRPALAWGGAAEVRSALAAAARERGAGLRFAGDQIEVRDPGGDPERRLELCVGGETHRLRFPHAGRHQLDNLGLAFAAARELAGLGWEGLDDPVGLEALARCRWPGRLEEVPIGAGRSVLLDAAHNPSGAAALAAHLERSVGSYGLLFAALRDKAAGAMLPPLASGATEVFLTEPPDSKAWPAARLRRLVGRGQVEPSFERALDAALSCRFETLVICGSIYLVGAARTSLRRRYGVPAPARDPLWPPLSRRR